MPQPDSRGWTLNRESRAAGLTRAVRELEDLRSVLTRVEAERDEALTVMERAGLQIGETNAPKLSPTVIALEAQRDSLTTALREAEGELRRIAEIVDAEADQPLLLATADRAAASLSSLEDT